MYKLINFRSIFKYYLCIYKKKITILILTRKSNLYLTSFNFIYQFTKKREFAQTSAIRF